MLKHFEVNSAKSLVNPYLTVIAPIGRDTAHTSLPWLGLGPSIDQFEPIFIPICSLLASSGRFIFGTFGFPISFNLVSLLLHFILF